MYKRGDVVKVWSLQSFHGGGFLDGEKAIVRQDQTGKSVILIVTRNMKGEYIIDSSYEVYTQQTKLIKEATDIDREKVELFLELNQKIRTWEHVKKKDYDLPYHYAKEFYFDEDMDIQFDKNKVEYPEMFI